MRRLVPFVVVATLAGACSGEAVPAGPASPIDQRATTAVGADEEAGARAAALAFLEAYARAPSLGARDLDAAIAPGWLRRWSHWVGVQADAFPGDQEAELVVRWLGPAAIVSRDEEVRVRDVDVDASAVFHLSPTEGAPFDVTRTFARVRVALIPGRGWRVVDAVRDGLPLSAAFRSFHDPLPFARDRGVGVAIDSLVAYPVWQFHLVALALRGEARLRSAQLLDAEGTVVAEADAVTRSIATVPGDRPVEGIVSFDAQPSAEGLRLEMVYVHDGGSRTVGFELGELLPAAEAGSAS
jgi:hypothetical protein